MPKHFFNTDLCIFDQKVRGLRTKISSLRSTYSIKCFHTMQLFSLKHGFQITQMLNLVKIVFRPVRGYFTYAKFLLFVVDINIYLKINSLDNFRLFQSELKIFFSQFLHLSLSLNLNEGHVMFFARLFETIHLFSSLYWQLYVCNYLLAIFEF